jgi:hypothetical protein
MQLNQWSDLHCIALWQVGIISYVWSRIRQIHLGGFLPQTFNLFENCNVFEDVRLPRDQVLINFIFLKK